MTVTLYACGRPPNLLEVGAEGEERRTGVRRIMTSCEKNLSIVGFYPSYK